MSQLKRKIGERLFMRQWFLIFQLGGSTGTKLEDYQKIIPPNDRYWADPHVIHKNGIYHVFFEEWIASENRGSISVINISEKGDVSEAAQVLREPYHLSYPFIFEFEDVTYMIPETHEQKTVQVYAATDFPKKWRLDRVLLSGIDTVDSTLFFHGGEWWMFTCIRNGDSYNDVHVFYADSPLADRWTPHPMNPVSTSTDNSRSAGNIFVRNGRIYRPTQTLASGEYGRKIVVNEITRLDKDGFEERPDHVIEPWNSRILGVHTINRAERLTVLDAKWRIRRK